MPNRPSKPPSGRPYIICHMLGSLDGKILSSRWPKIGNGNLFEKYGSQIAADGWIVGRKTMAEFSSKTPAPQAPGHVSASRRPITSRRTPPGLTPSASTRRGA